MARVRRAIIRYMRFLLVLFQMSPLFTDLGHTQRLILQQRSFRLQYEAGRRPPVCIEQTSDEISDERHAARDPLGRLRAETSSGSALPSAAADLRSCRPAT